MTTSPRLSTSAPTASGVSGAARHTFSVKVREAAPIRNNQDRPSSHRILEGRAEARLIALACAAPPAGRKEWTMKLLADRLVELEVVDSVCDETVRRVLKKT